MADDGVPVEERVFGDGDYLRSSFIEPNRCSNVLIEDVTIVNSPMWEVHPTMSDHVLVQGLTVDSHGPNNDGCNPESSRMVVIKDCTFDTGDDCIAIKSGRNADGRRVNVPSQDILIEGCTMRDGHGGVTIGSEMSGGVRNVFAQDCEMSSPNLDIALRFKTNSLRGGFVEGFYARNIDVGVVGQAVIDINFYYEEGPGQGFNPVVGDLSISNLTVQSAKQSLNLRGYSDDHITNVHLSNVDFGTTTAAPVVEYVDGLVLDNVHGERRAAGHPIGLEAASGQGCSTVSARRISANAARRYGSTSTSAPSLSRVSRSATSSDACWASSSGLGTRCSASSSGCTPTAPASTTTSTSTSTSGNQVDAVRAHRAITSPASSPDRPPGCRSSSSIRSTSPRTSPTCSRSCAPSRSVARRNASSSATVAARTASVAAAGEGAHRRGVGAVGRHAPKATWRRYPLSRPRGDRQDE